MNEEMKDPIILPSGEDLKKPMRHRDPRKAACCCWRWAASWCWPRWSSA